MGTRDRGPGRAVTAKQGDPIAERANGGDDPYLGPPLPDRSGGTTAGMAILLTGLAMMAVAAFWVIGTEPTHGGRHVASAETAVISGKVAMERVEERAGQLSIRPPETR